MSTEKLYGTILFPQRPYSDESRQISILKPSCRIAARWIGEVEIERDRRDQLRDFVYLIAGLEENNESNYLSVKKAVGVSNIRSIGVSKLEFFKDERSTEIPRIRNEIRKRSTSNRSISSKR